MKVIVIGAGVIGMACAWRLAAAGARVEILEARDCGQGATRGALGALWPASPLVKGPLQQLHRESLWQFEAFAAELSAAAGNGVGLPVSYRRQGRLELLNSEKAGVRAAAETLAACAGWPAFAGALPVMEVLSPAEIQARWPQLAPAAHAGLLCRATAQVSVPELVAGLQAACARAGVVLHRQTPAIALEIRGARVLGVRTGAGLAEADAVLAAMGAWTALLAPELAAIAPIRPAKGQGIALQTPAGVRLETIVKSESIYLIPWHTEAGGEILVGSTTEPEAGFDETPSPEAREKLLAGAAGIVPGLKDAVVLRHWAGLRPQNPAKRHPPIMGPHPKIGNLFVCTGHFKTGIGLAPLVSRLMCQTLLTGSAAPTLAPFCPH